MSITENKNRIGNFTSSPIHKLTKVARNKVDFGAPALTYIQEKRIEKRMGRSIDVEKYGRPMAWGNFCETYVANLLEDEYILESDNTVVHSTISGWAGSPDLVVPEVKIGDIKCYEPKNFGLLAECLLQKSVTLFKTEFPAEYWQLVSNACIMEVDRAELILFMPYKSELPVLREMAETYEGADQWKYRFISEAADAELPHLPDGGFYENIVRFEFEVPVEDKKFLTEKVISAICKRDL